jgi:hypothetical protein
MYFVPSQGLNNLRAPCRVFTTEEEQIADVLKTPPKAWTCTFDAQHEY